MGSTWQTCLRKANSIGNVTRFADSSMQCPAAAYTKCNDRLNILTTQGKYELLITMKDFSNQNRYAMYDKVEGDEKSKYKLIIGAYHAYSGNAVFDVTSLVRLLSKHLNISKGCNPPIPKWSIVPDSLTFRNTDFVNLVCSLINEHSHISRRAGVFNNICSSIF
ncbi:unnamed protein product [Mytilus edulis]|uniref:Fibrinogen C-terminal domain-containing protein n=1 Tax=Mytilus edulis TaxID=6550 RepID=A0A8S3QWF4_MYTED|nr:unnamed protein product [Mytilus edulis]